MGSTESVLVWIISFFVLAAILFLAYKFSYKLGIKKALYRTTYILLCVIFAFILAPIVNEFLVEYDLSKINITLSYREKTVTTIIDYIEEIIAHSKFLNDLYVYFPSLKDLFMDFPQILLVPFTYVALFIAFIIILLPLYLYLSYRRKRRILYDRGDRVHHRAWAGVLGCVQCIFIISVLLSPLNGIGRIYRNATSGTLKDDESSLCQEVGALNKYNKYCNIIELYNSTIFSTIGGNDSISDYIFDSLTRISYGDGYANFSDEASMIIKSGIVLNQSKLLDIILNDTNAIPMDIVLENTLKDEDIDIIVETLKNSKYSEEILSELEQVSINTLNNVLEKELEIRDFEIVHELNEEERINEIKIILKAISSFGGSNLLNDIKKLKSIVSNFVNNVPENRKSEEVVFSFLYDVSTAVDLDEFELFCEYLFESKVFNSIAPYILDKWFGDLGLNFVDTDGDVLDQFYNAMDFFRLIREHHPETMLNLIDSLTQDEMVMLSEIAEYMMNDRSSVKLVRKLIGLAFSELPVDYHIEEIMAVKNLSKEIPFVKELCRVLLKITNKQKPTLKELIGLINYDNSELSGIFKKIVSENRMLFIELIVEE